MFFPIASIPGEGSILANTFTTISENLYPITSIMVGKKITYRSFRHQAALSNNKMYDLEVWQVLRAQCGLLVWVVFFPNA